jgi:hypothetical protein
MENQKQDFAKAILELTDSVYHTKTQHENNFYLFVKNLGATVQIEIGNSTNVELSFIFVKSTEITTISNLSLGSIFDCADFMNGIYNKHEAMLNNHSDTHAEFNNKLEFALKKENDSPFCEEQINESVKLILNEPEYNISINLREVYNRYNPTTFKPLEPLVFDCFMTQKNGDVCYFKKVIPAYRISEYPILKDKVLVNNSENELSTFIDNMLANATKPNTSKLLSKILLDISIPKNNINPPKFKL